MSEPLKIRWDGTVNWPMLIALMVAVGSGGAFVNGKFDQLARVVEETAANSQEIENLRDEIRINRAETIENRRVYLEGRK